MYSKGTLHGTVFVRTQRCAQFRRMLMATGGVSLAAAGVLSFGTLFNEHDTNRTLAETGQIASAVELNKTSIEAALADADRLAEEIGDQVADPRVAANFAQLREQARTLVKIKIDMPDLLDGTNRVNETREIASGILAADSAAVANLQKGADLMRKSNEEYLARERAKAEAIAARESLNNLMIKAEEALAVSGGIADELTARHPLSQALDAARLVAMDADKALGLAEESAGEEGFVDPDFLAAGATITKPAETTEEYAALTAKLRAEGDKLAAASSVVQEAVVAAGPIIMVDTDGDGIAETPMVDPNYVPPVAGVEDAPVELDEAGNPIATAPEPVPPADQPTQ